MVRTIKQIKQALQKALSKMYIGDGLYLEIDQLSILFNYDEGETEDTESTASYDYEISGRYGRDAGTDNDFQFDFKLNYTDEESNDFISGMFYKVIESNMNS